MKKAALALMAILCVFSLASCSYLIDPVTYTVTFDANETDATSMPAEQTVLEGTTATVPKDPEMPAGKAFAGWYKETSCTTLFDFNAAITENTVVYASSTNAEPAPVEGSGYFSSEINTFLEKYKGLEKLPANLNTQKDLANAIGQKYSAWEYDGKVKYLDGTNYTETITVDLAEGEVRDALGNLITTLTEEMKGTITIEWSLNPTTPESSEFTVSYTGTFEGESFVDVTITTGTSASFYPYSDIVDTEPFSAFTEAFIVDAAEKTTRFVNIIKHQNPVKNLTSQGTDITKGKFTDDKEGIKTDSEFTITTVYEVNGEATVTAWIIDTNIITDDGNFNAIIHSVQYEEYYGCIDFHVFTLKVDDGDEYKFTLGPS